MTIKAPSIAQLVYADRRAKRLLERYSKNALLAMDAAKIQGTYFALFQATLNLQSCEHILAAIKDKTFSFTAGELFVAMVATAKDQIRASLQGRQIMAFRDLHNFTDANLFGGSELLLQLLGMETATDLINRMQNELDAWIKDGMKE